MDWLDHRKALRKLVWQVWPKGQRYQSQCGSRLFWVEIAFRIGCIALQCALAAFGNFPSFQLWVSQFSVSIFSVVTFLKFSSARVSVRVCLLNWCDFHCIYQTWWINKHFNFFFPFPSSCRHYLESTTRIPIHSATLFRRHHTAVASSPPLRWVLFHYNLHGTCRLVYQGLDGATKVVRIRQRVTTSRAGLPS